MKKRRAEGNGRGPPLDTCAPGGKLANAHISRCGWGNGKRCAINPEPKIVKKRLASPNLEK